MPAARNKKSQKFFKMESWTSRTFHNIGMALPLSARRLCGLICEKWWIFEFSKFRWSFSANVKSNFYVKIWSVSDAYGNVLQPWKFTKLCFFWEYVKLFLKNFKNFEILRIFDFFYFLKIPAGFTSQFGSFFWYVKIRPNFYVPHV